MTYPHDAAMLTLIAVAFGDTLTVPDGEIILEINGSGLLPDHGTATVPIQHDDLTALEERGWIEHHEDGTTTATERGRYWIERWWDARKKKRGVNAKYGGCVNSIVRTTTRPVTSGTRYRRGAG